MPLFRQSALLPASARAVADWHARRGALERLVPAWSRVRVERSIDELRDGAVATLRVPAGPTWSPLRLRWEAMHEDVRPGVSFADRMVRGPLRKWRHEHRFLSADDRPQPASMLEDVIDYELPLGPLGRLGQGWVERDLHRLFTWRHVRTRNDLRRHAELGGAPLTVAISGASGLVGRALSAFLTTGGHRVRRLQRRAVDASRGDIAFDPLGGAIDVEGLAACDAVVHLAGESIAQRWNAASMQRIRDSRVNGTRVVAEAIARCGPRPPTLVCASAIGLYGARGDERVNEGAARGAGFLADVCGAWESAADPARAAGARVVHVRIGMVLARGGGALPVMLLPFSLGLGGRMGSGRQGMSWIAIDDLCAAILFALRTPALEGPVNAVGPNPVSNAEFSRVLGEALYRPTVLPAPAAPVRLLLGQMGTSLLLEGAFIEPARLAAAGFRFDFPTLSEALRFELGRMGTG